MLKYEEKKFYRAESDIPVPYGRTAPLNKGIPTTTSIIDLIPNGHQKRRDTLVAIMFSNCGSNSRTKFVKELQKYINIDIYGSCGTTLKKA